MSKQKAHGEDLSAQAAGAIGALAIVFGALAAIRDKLGLSWPATVLLTAGVLVGLGYLAWRLRTALIRLLAGDTRPAVAMKQEAPEQAQEAATEAAEEAEPVHSELTGVLSKAGAIGKDQVIRDSQVNVKELPNGTRYDFLMPEGRTHEDFEKRLHVVAGMFEVSRLHLKMEYSRDNERRVRFLKLHEPPFTHAFPAPSRQQIETFAGVPLGHDVTGQLVGVPTFDKASLLVAGMTQMGKTTLINGLITCLLIAYGEFELYLLDGKFCGLTKFEKVAARYESSDDPAVFEDMVDELNDRSDKRYGKLKDAIRNRQPAPSFKPVIFIVDEAADFFAHDESKEGKENARRIAEKTRSLVAKSLESGISTVLLTQRPSANAIPVMVRDQFLYRMCLYVASGGTAKVALGDTYFETVAPINPALLNPDIKGQAVLFANGRSTLIRGFHFEDPFMHGVVDEIVRRQSQEQEEQEPPDTPLHQAIEVMRSAGVEFMLTADLAPALGVTESDAAERGKQLNALLGVTASRTAQGRGYKLDDLLAALRTSS